MIFYQFNEIVCYSLCWSIYSSGQTYGELKKKKKRRKKEGGGQGSVRGLLGPQVSYLELAEKEK